MGFLESCSNVKFDPLQFGFVNGRGTAMAAATVNNVMDYCVNKGSTVFCCSLDAEGAFDAIPHDVIFNKLCDNMCDDWWRCFLSLYTNLTVNVKWNGNIGRKINICKGTRQGGLS